MEKLTNDEKCLLMFALGIAAGSVSADKDGKPDHEAMKPFMDMAQKLAGADIYLEHDKEAKE